ncbi:hypothetical protein [Streptomyces sp. NBC_00483]|uniref:hypothetical protein n=1 Tax=Streptomyces sp. NBC_00483 TaxID=2975756 RepID=UPI002E17EA03
MGSHPEHSTHSFVFGAGAVDLSAETGAPTRFTDPDAPERNYLLDPRTTPWHSIEHQWGSGHLVSDQGSARWCLPDQLQFDGAGSRSVHRLLPSLQLHVERSAAAETFTEQYTLRNTGPEPVTINAWGIQTPFGDLYDGAEHALQQAVHAHVFTGGTWAWALAQPMDARGRHLGLVLREGALHAYAVESRNKNSLSNARGHLVLLATDRARNPQAFGGQPRLVLAPNQETTVRWEIGWYDSPADFLHTVRPPARLSHYAMQIGDPLTVEAAEVSSPSNELHVAEDSPGRYRITAAHPGMYDLHFGTARTQVLFHPPLRHVVERRADYMLRHQRADTRPGLLAHAFVPLDTRTLLTQATNGWSDWSDGSERIAMPLLLQLATARGWLDRTRTEPALRKWALFARAHLLDETAAPRRGSQDRHTGVRLYDSPWLAQFFHDHYRLLGDADDLDVAARIMERNFELGGREFLALTLSTTTRAIADSLDTAGMPRRAQALRAQVVDSARHFVKAGIHLPHHEVAYEQSMVAPLLDLFTDAYALTQDPQFYDALADRLPWLLAFSGPQPHARLHGIAIRHWDGYWFGANRLWGDVFPHHWSTLTANTLLRLPEGLRTEHTARLAEAILHANMANYYEDGSATCAFVMPSTVDGRPAHTADPLANDQDWHLVLWLRLLDELPEGVCSDAAECAAGTPEGTTAASL